MKKSAWLIMLSSALAGLLILTYPTFSDYMNRRNASYTLCNTLSQIDEMDPLAQQAAYCDARAYNDALLTGRELPEYTQVLDLGDGLMGSLEIPTINVYLPIYHGTESETLSHAIGHMPQTALPIGGKGSHTVLTGHTGLPAARLLSDLTQLQEGDVFHLHVLQATLTYCVDQILVVLPEDGTALQPVAGKDYCTLVTCTPNRINSHRLLVRGERVTQQEQIQTEISSSVPLLPPVPVGLWLAGGGLLLLLLSAMLIILLKKERGV